MINIIEYLINKDNIDKIHKINNIDRPIEGCNFENIIRWIENFNIENWYNFHKYPEKMNVGDFRWKINKSEFNNEFYLIFSNQFSESQQRDVVIYKNKCIGYIGVNSHFNLSFEKAISFIEAMIKNPTKFIQQKDII